MQIKKIITKIDSYQMAIESVAVLVADCKEELILKPILNYLKERKRDAAMELSSIANNIEVQLEETINL